MKIVVKGLSDLGGHYHQIGSGESPQITMKRFSNELLPTSIGSKKNFPSEAKISVFVKQTYHNLQCIIFFCRALLPRVSECGPGDSGHDKCLVVSRQRGPLIYHISDIIAWPCALPHTGLPLPNGMYHLWYQLHCYHGGIQPQWAELQLHLSGLLIQ